MTKPFLSLAAICGDAHVKLLPRMLKSIIERPGGPLCDELVIGWNGRDDGALYAALEAAGGSQSKNPHRPGSQCDHGYCEHSTLGAPEGSDLSYGLLQGDNYLPLLVHRQTWRNNFAQARQENFERASGTWRMYADVDDTILLPDDPRAKFSREDEAPDRVVTPKSTTLQDRLRALPPHINVLVAPYWYVLSDKGLPMVRKRRPRIVKWDSYWAWTGEVHELLRHSLAREFGLYDAGLIFLHEPVIAAEERADRNYEIAEEKIKALGDAAELPIALRYGIACRAFDNGNYAEATKLFVGIAKDIGDREEKLQYLVMGARSAIDARQFKFAGSIAAEAVAVAPARPEGYLVACEAACALHEYPYAIEWYEAGGEKKVPPGAMITDRYKMLAGAARSVGVAYLVTRQYEKALAVAARALSDVSDPFAIKLKERAELGLRQGRIYDSISTTAELLLAHDFPGAAQRVLDAVKPALGASDLGEIERRVRTRIEARPTPIPPQSGLWSFFGDAGPNDTSIAVSVDAAEDPAALIATAVAQTLDGAAILLTTSDIRAPSPSRVAALPAEILLAELEPHGDVTGLALYEEEQPQGTARFLTARVVKKKKAAPWKPDVTFFAPVYAEPWGPWRIRRDGTGGSEESVVYLAAEMARRGLRVQVYAALDEVHAGVHIEEGVRWRPTSALDFTRAIPGVTIACRSPDAARMPCFDPSRLYIWHQDAWYYSNGWTIATANAVRSLFVSEWQKSRLLRSVTINGNGNDRYGIVCGNGIPATCLDWHEDGRDPLASAYLSSPIRGLVNALDAWPAIAAAFPKASLHLYYGWHTTPDVPGLPSQTAMMEKIESLPNVHWHDRVPQSALEVALPKFSVWAYPCDFPEGFCVAGIRATAAGMIPIYRKIAALPEVQYPSPFAVAETEWAKGGREQFIDSWLAALKLSASGDVNREQYREWARRHTWGRVADRILEDFKARRLL